MCNFLHYVFLIIGNCYFIILSSIFYKSLCSIQPSGCKINKSAILRVCVDTGRLSVCGL